MKAMFRAIHLPTFIILFLLFIAAGSVALSLSTSVRGLGNELLVKVAFIGLLVGWVFAQVPWRGWLSYGSAAFVGALGIWLSLGILLPKLGSLLSRVITWMVRYLGSQHAVLPEAGEVQAGFVDLGSSAAVVSARLVVWIGSVIAGKAEYDPLASAILWCFILWLISAWAGWAVQRGYSSLAALFPGTGLATAVLGYSNENTTILAVLLLVTFFLFVLLGQTRRESRWNRKNVDFSLEIRGDLALTAIPLSLMLVAIAAVTPSISIPKIIETLNRWAEQQGTHINQVGDPLGLKPQTIAAQPFQGLQYPGLPRDHLIGSGPELSEQVVMTVRTYELPPTPAEFLNQQPARYYWRGLVYDRYTGNGWATSQTSIQAYEPGEVMVSDPAQSHHPVQQEVSYLQDIGGILHAAGQIMTADQRYQIAWRSTEDYFAARVETSVYRAHSSVPIYSPDQLRQVGRGYPDWLQARYLELPASIPDRVLGLARDLTATAPTPYDQAVAIEAYLRTIPYTLDLPAPPSGRDVVDYFLFDLRQGYCDYYASSMVILARAAGLPARLVVGYATGSYESLNARYIVTEAEAHSWPEIYFPGYGWIEFEPTAARPGRESAPEVVPTPEILAGPVEDVYLALPILPPLHMLILWMAAGLVAAFSLWWLFSPPLERYLFRNDPRKSLGRLFHRIQKTARRLGIRILPGDTPYEFADRLSNYIDFSFAETLLQPVVQTTRSEILGIVDLYVRSVYSPRLPSYKEVEIGVQSWNHLRYRLWLAWLGKLVGLRSGKK